MATTICSKWDVTVRSRMLFRAKKPRWLRVGGDDYTNRGGCSDYKGCNEKTMQEASDHDNLFLALS